MTALVQAFSRRLSSVAAEHDTAKLLAILCGVGLLISLLLAIDGLDLSPDLF